jgi:hypothetical protein
MSTFPTSPRAAFLLWCQEHAPVWTANATSIGLTAAQATAFSAAVTAAADSNLDLETARQAYRAAVAANDDAFAALRAANGDTLKLIRAFAQSSVKPMTVYTLAQIPPPATPQPAPPPGQPTNLAAALQPASGHIALSWKCANPAGASGTSYIIRRKLPAEAGFTFIGVATGGKRFTDTSLPAGLGSVQYTVQAQRSDSSGPESEVFTVNFGSGAGGGLTVQRDGRAPKLAA